MKKRLYLTIGVEIETTLPLGDAADELQTETDYTIGSTPNIKVLETEIVDCYAIS